MEHKIHPTQKIHLRKNNDNKKKETNHSRRPTQNYTSVNRRSGLLYWPARHNECTSVFHQRAYILGPHWVPFGSTLSLVSLKYNVCLQQNSMTLVHIFASHSYILFREKSMLGVFTNRVLRRIFGPKSDEVSGVEKTTQQGALCSVFLTKYY
jgi:hypothetical protein